MEQNMEIEAEPGMISGFYVYLAKYYPPKGKLSGVCREERLLGSRRCSGLSFYQSLGQTIL